MLRSEQVGRYLEGSVQEPARSALSGKPLAPGYAQINLGGGRFVRVAGGEWRGLTRAERDALKAEWQRHARDVDAAAGREAPADPELDALSFNELKALAASENIDISGRRSAEDVRHAIRSARVHARFAEPDTAADASAESEE